MKQASGLGTLLQQVATGSDSDFDRGVVARRVDYALTGTGSLAG